MWSTAELNHLFIVIIFYLLYKKNSYLISFISFYKKTPYICDPQLNWAVFFGGPRHLPGTSHADELFLQVCNFPHFLLFLSFFWWTHSSFAVVTASWNSYTVRFNQSFPRPCLPVLYWNHFTVNRLQTKYVKIILNGTSLLYRVCKNCTYFKVGLGM